MMDRPTKTTATKGWTTEEEEEGEEENHLEKVRKTDLETGRREKDLQENMVH